MQHGEREERGGRRGVRVCEGMRDGEKGVRRGEERELAEEKIAG